jgi:acyl-CoA thioesterase I
MRYFTKSLYLISMAAFCLFTAKVQAQIVAFGASNVAGKGVWPAEAWPAQLEQMLKAKGYNVHVKNAGKSGDTTSGMLHRLNSAIPSGTKIVILDVSGGYHNNLDATAASRQKGPADMTEIEARLKASGITVIRESAGGVSLAYKQADKLHLTAEGHKLLAERLLPRVISALSGSTG